MNIHVSKRRFFSFKPSPPASVWQSRTRPSPCASSVRPNSATGDPCTLSSRPAVHAGICKPPNDGVWFSKRWVSFHKTTPILFEGFSHPSFFSLWGLSPLRVLSRRFCSFRFCVSLVLAAFSLVFPLFGGWTLLFGGWTLLFSWLCLVVVVLCVFLPLKMSLGSTWALIECLTNLGSFSLYVIGRFAVILFL